MVMSLKTAVELAMIDIYSGVVALRAIDDFTSHVGDQNAIVACDAIRPTGKPNCYFCDVDFIAATESHKDKDQVKIAAIDADNIAFIRSLTPAAINAKLSDAVCVGLYPGEKFDGGDKYSALKESLGVRTWTKTIVVEAN